MGCYDRCISTESFLATGKCDYCNGYCCRPDRNTNRCTLHLTNIVRENTKWSDRHTNFCIYLGYSDFSIG